MPWMHIKSSRRTELLWGGTFIKLERKIREEVHSILSLLITTTTKTEKLWNELMETPKYEPSWDQKSWTEKITASIIFWLAHQGHPFLCPTTRGTIQWGQRADRWWALRGLNRWLDLKDLRLLVGHRLCHRRDLTWAPKDQLHPEQCLDSTEQLPIIVKK